MWRKIPWAVPSKLKNIKLKKATAQYLWAKTYVNVGINLYEGKKKKIPLVEKQEVDSGSIFPISLCFSFTSFQSEFV